MGGDWPELYPDLGPELASFRTEVREWISSAAPAGLADLTNWYDGSTVLAGSNRDVHSLAKRSELYRQWEQALLEEALIYPHWPEHAGGKGWSHVKSSVFAEECRRAGVPRVRRGFSADLVGSALLGHGTLAQQAHFLPRIVSGLDRYCQGFSEPNHGSDLGAVETSGVVEGDEIVVSGQKVWTSAFADANMIFVLCRTDSAAPRGEALSFVLLPFGEENNIDVRGIRQMTGAVEFAEDFLDGARAPLFNVIGGVGNGWSVAMATLSTERNADLLVSHLGYTEEFDAVLDAARQRDVVSDPLIRDRLVRAYIDTQVLRAQSFVAMTHSATNHESHVLGMVAKLQASEYAVRLGELAVDIGGAEGIVRPGSDSSEAPPFEDDYAVDRWQDLLLTSRGATIFSGANEIQRNLISEQLLGLPRETRGKTDPARSPKGSAG